MRERTNGIPKVYRDKEAAHRIHKVTAWFKWSTDRKPHFYYGYVSENKPPRRLAFVITEL